MQLLRILCYHGAVHKWRHAILEHSLPPSFLLVMFLHASILMPGTPHPHPPPPTCMIDNINGSPQF